MFNIQPGTGLGFTGAKQIALGLGGGFEPEIIEPPFSVPGSGSGKGIQHAPGTRRALAMREDEEILLMLEAWLRTRRH